MVTKRDDEKLLKIISSSCNVETNNKLSWINIQMEKATMISGLTESEVMEHYVPKEIHEDGSLLTNLNDNKSYIYEKYKL